MSGRQDLVSRGEIANRTGVRRPAVSNWGRRHANFPTPVVVDDGLELFGADQVAAWLDQRRIPVNALASGEQAGATYGQRFRRGTAYRPTARPMLAAEHGRAAKIVRGLERLAGLVSVPETAYRELVLFALAEYSGSADYMELSTPARHWRDRALPLIRETLGRHEVDRDQATLLFDQLLDGYQTTDRRRSAEPQTSPSLADLMGGLVAADTVRSVCDPYCRSGELLTPAARRAGDVTVHGRSPREEDVRRARWRLRLHGIDAAIQQAPQVSSGLRVDAVVTNPPFNAHTPQYFGARAWKFGKPPDHNANFGWLQHAVETLDGPNARAAVLMPSTAAVSSHPQERTIRERMVRAGVVECVIALPAGLFAATGAMPMLWLLRPPRTSVGTVLFIDASGREAAPTGRYEIPEDTRDRIIDVYRRWRGGQNFTDTPVRCGEVGGELIAEQPSCPLNPLRYLRAVTPELAKDHTKLAAELRDTQMRARDADERVEGLLATGVRPAERDRKRRPNSVPLGTVCQIQPGPSGSLLRRRPSDGRGVTVVEPRNLVDHRVRGELRTVPAAQGLDMNRYSLEPDDILAVRTGAPGRCALVTRTKPNLLYAASLVRLRPHRGQIDPRYLLYYLNLPVVVEWVRSNSIGTTVRSITTDLLRELPIILPALSEQRDIAERLELVQVQAEVHTEAAERSRALRDVLVSTLIAAPDLDQTPTANKDKA